MSLAVYIILEHSTPAPWRSVLQRSADRPVTKVTEVPKTVEDSPFSFKLRRTSFLRDSNFNYDNDVVDV